MKRSNITPCTQFLQRTQEDTKIRKSGAATIFLSFCWIPKFERSKISANDLIVAISSISEVIDISLKEPDI